MQFQKEDIVLWPIIGLLERVVTFKRVDNQVVETGITIPYRPEINLDCIVEGNFKYDGPFNVQKGMKK